MVVVATYIKPNTRNSSLQYAATVVTEIHKLRPNSEVVIAGDFNVDLQDFEDWCEPLSLQPATPTQEDFFSYRQRRPAPTAIEEPMSNSTGNI